MHHLNNLCCQYLTQPVSERTVVLKRILCPPKLGPSRTNTHGHISPLREQLRKVAGAETITVQLLARGGTRNQSDVTRAESFMRQGYLGRASKTLFEDQTAVNPADPEVLDELESLQCDADLLSYPEGLETTRPDEITESKFLKCANSLKLDSASGPSGWPVFLLRLAMRQLLKYCKISVVIVIYIC